MTLSNDKKDEEDKKEICPFAIFTTSKEFEAYTYGLKDVLLLFEKLNPNKKYTKSQLMNILTKWEKKLTDEMEGHDNYQKATLQKNTKESIRANRISIDTKIKDRFKAAKEKAWEYKNHERFNEQKIIKRLFSPSEADYSYFGELEQLSNSKYIVSDYIYLEKPMDQICYIYKQEHDGSLQIGRLKKNFDQTGKEGQRFAVNPIFSIKDDETNWFYISKRLKQGDGDLPD